MEYRRRIKTGKEQKQEVNHWCPCFTLNPRGCKLKEKADSSKLICFDDIEDVEAINRIVQQCMLGMHGKTLQTIEPTRVSTESENFGE